MHRAITVFDRKKLLSLFLILIGVGFISLGFVADAIGLGGGGSLGPNQLALMMSGFALLLGGMLLVSSVERRYIGEWLLVGAAVIGVAYAADLLVLGTKAMAGSKYIMLASVAISAVLAGVVPLSTLGWQFTGRWPKVLTIDTEKTGKFLAIAVQLGLIVLLIRLFQLENQAFYHNLILLTFFGFLAHYFLPFQYRLAFFFLLSITAIFGILGFQNGAWLVGIGLGLILIAHLPLPFRVRVALLVGIGIVLALMRGNWMPSIVPTVIWPILGSVFMFRLIIYMYDLSHSKEPVNLPRTFSYFFLLPNVVFPFFPLVDFNTFKRTYYDEDRYRIYQSGIGWMLVGVIHLILYRFVNYYLMIAPDAVDSFASLVRFAVSNFLLYLKISGQFHLIIGILHLFGFHLPRTNNHYFLAAGFVDLWRRVNIYWKEFMLKVFYYPIYFRMKKMDGTTRLILATALVMFLTWLLHAYQWFWLRGTLFFVLPDIVFWSILGTLVVVDVVIESRRKKRSSGIHTWNYREFISLSVSIALTFATISILWSMWSSNSIPEWWSLWSILGGSLQTMALYLLLFAGIGLLSGTVIWFGFRIGIGVPKKEKETPFFRSAFLSGGVLLFVILLGTPGVYTRLPGKANTLLSDLSTPRLSQRDALQLQKGYYEDLTGVDRFNSDLWEIYSKRPTEWPLIQETEAARMTGDFRILELLPLKKIDFHGGEFTTNRWGMRDMDYEQLPAPDTYRIALVGPSFVMGSGISDRDVFEAILERHLNERNDGKRYSKYEILNFAVAGYSSLQELWIFDDKAVSFKPKAVIFVSHQIEEEVTVRNLALSLATGVEIPYDDLLEIARKAGVQEGMPQSEVERLLKPYGAEILAWTYQRFVQVAREHDIIPVWLYLPTLEFPVIEEEKLRVANMAEQAGFTILDLSRVYDNQEIGSIIVAEWDLHPNAKGNQLIASRLYEALLEKEEVLQLGLPVAEDLP
jgi:hypothetical protein